MYNDERQEKMLELNSLVAPKVDEVISKSHKIADTISSVIEAACTQVYNDTTKEMVSVIDNLGDKPVVQYEGLQYLFEYAKESQLALMDVIYDSVLKSEELAKQVTAAKVDEITKYGKTHWAKSFSMIRNSILS